MYSDSTSPVAMHILLSQCTVTCSRCLPWTQLYPMACCVQSVFLTSYIQPNVSSTHSSTRSYVAYSVGPSSRYCKYQCHTHSLNQVVCCVLIRCTVSCTLHKEHGVLQTVYLVLMLQVCEYVSRSVYILVWHAEC